MASPLPVPPELEVRAHQTREEWVESGRFAVELLCRTLERGDLSEVDLLDVGCGTKLVKTLLDNSMSIGRYVGVDTQAKIVDWLTGCYRAWARSTVGRERRPADLQAGCRAAAIARAP